MADGGRVVNEVFLCEAVDEERKIWSEWLWGIAYLGRRATDERAWVVVELHQSQVKRASTLSSSIDHYRFRPWHCDQLWFVALRKYPVDVKLPLKRYTLDGGEIGVSFQLRCQLQDVMQLWKACKVLDNCFTQDHTLKREEVDNAMRTLVQARFERYTRKFCQNTTIAYLINNTLDMIQSFQQLSTRATAYQRLEDELEREARKVSVDGLAILAVDAEIDWSGFEHAIITEQQAQLPTDNDTFKKVIERQNQYTQRQHTNFLLDNDTTFAPYNLCHLIMALNPELLEKFYQAPSWDEAMQAVYAAIDKKKKERLEEKDKELARLRKAIEDAQAVKMRDDELRRLQTLFVDTVIEQRTTRQSLQSTSPQMLLQELLGPAQNRLLTVNNGAEPTSVEIVS
jgi:hypothetical protein